MKIIIGLGNIGERYTKTRHNIGFQVVNEIAEEHNANWKENTKLRSFIAEINIGGEKIILVKPTTFYNLSGFSARLVADYYKVNHLQDMLVIQDDLSIEFGIIRVKDIGSAGGNNGIRSIIGQFNTKFWRMKIGTANNKLDLIPAADFVLSKFTAEEAQIIPEIKQKALEIAENFAKDKIEKISFKFKTN